MLLERKILNQNFNQNPKQPEQTQNVLYDRAEFMFNFTTKATCS